jgi:putative FmdB family regulatory protein
MARYEYRCRTCDERFELRRAMSDADTPASCSAGHINAVRLLSVFASVGGANPAGAEPAPIGGCGAACGCHHS